MRRSPTRTASHRFPIGYQSRTTTVFPGKAVSSGSTGAREAVLSFGGRYEDPQSRSFGVRRYPGIGGNRYPAGRPGMDIVGLPDGAVRESRERVRVALRNCGFQFPRDRILLESRPGRHPQGRGFVRSADRQRPCSMPPISFHHPIREPVMILGELELSGRVRPVRGVLSAVASGLGEGVRRFLVPRTEPPGSAFPEGRRGGRDRNAPASSRARCGTWWTGPPHRRRPPRTTGNPARVPSRRTRSFPEADFRDLLGQSVVKWDRRSPLPDATTCFCSVLRGAEKPWLRGDCRRFCRTSNDGRRSK